MEWMLRFCILLQNTFLFLLRPVYWYINRTKLPSISPVENPILKISAVELAKKIRNKEIFCEKVVAAYIARIKEVNPIINAVVDDRFEDAVKDARDYDKKLEAGELTAEELEKNQPFYGIPFTVKESCGLKGLSQTGCTLVRKGTKASSDSLIVESMRKAGAIPLCVTNTPELCAGFETANMLYGRTQNPYDGRRIAGGSSGGEAALIAAGGSLIGIGSDLAGSIRVPALFTGIFGHKPTSGIIPIKGHYPLSPSPAFQKYLVLGPMSRYIDDLTMAVKVMSSGCGKDLKIDEPVDVGTLKICYLEDNGYSFPIPSVDVEIKKCIRRAVAFFKNRGVDVEEANVGDLSEMLEISISMLFGVDQMPRILVDPDDPKHEKSAVNEMFNCLKGQPMYTKAAIYIQYLKENKAFISKHKHRDYEAMGREIEKKFLDLLGENTVLLYPTFIRTAPYANQIVMYTAGGVYSLPWNLFGLPATQVPMGLSSRDKLPTGFQVIAGPYQDRLCLAVAKELEKAFGGWVPPHEV